MFNETIHSVFIVRSLHFDLGFHLIRVKFCTLWVLLKRCLIFTILAIVDLLFVPKNDLLEQIAVERIFVLWPGVFLDLLVGLAWIPSLLIGKFFSYFEFLNAHVHADLGALLVHPCDQGQLVHLEDEPVCLLEVDEDFVLVGILLVLLCADYQSQLGHGELELHICAIACLLRVGSFLQRALLLHLIHNLSFIEEAVRIQLVQLVRQSDLQGFFDGVFALYLRPFFVLGWLRELQLWILCTPCLPHGSFPGL